MNMNGPGETAPEDFAGIPRPSGRTSGFGQAAVAGAGAALDRRGVQAVDVHLVAQLLEEAQLLLEGVAVGGRQKGNVRFDGLGVVTRASLVRQYDDLSRQPFPNLLFRIRLLDLSADGDRIDWGWISARRRSVPLPEADRRAPTAWKQWVEEGHQGLDGLALRRWLVRPLSAG